MLDRQAVHSLFGRKKPTDVIHLAARVGGLFANMKANVEFLRENFGMNDTIFEECRLAGATLRYVTTLWLVGFLAALAEECALL